MLALSLRQKEDKRQTPPAHSDTLIHGCSQLVRLRGETKFIETFLPQPLFNLVPRQVPTLSHANQPSAHPYREIRNTLTYIRFPFSPLYLILVVLFQLPNKSKQSFLCEI